MRIFAVTTILALAACTPVHPPASVEDVVEEAEPTPVEQVDAEIVDDPDPPAATVSGLAKALEQHMLPCEADGITDEYDEIIKKAVNRYWSVERRAYYCWLKSVAWTESSFRENASGDDGDSLGLFQVRSRTWAEWADRLDMPAARATNAKEAARVAAAYMEFLGDRWIWHRPVESTITLASASYNAGFGNVLRAQREADMAKHWNAGIRDGLPKVTGRHSATTIEYIERIRDRYELMTGSKLRRY